MKNEAKKKTITFKSKICDPFLAQVLCDRQASSHSPRYPQPLHILVREVYILVKEVHMLVKEVHMFVRKVHILVRKVHILVREVHILVREAHILVREVHILVREVHILVREVRASLSSCIENVFSSKDDVGKLPQYPLNLEEEPGSKLLQVESLGH